MRFVTRRLFWVGLVICALAMLTTIITAGYEDFHHGLRYGALLLFTGMTLVFLGRWDAKPKVPFTSTYQQKLRHYVLWGMFIVPLSMLLWGVGYGYAALWVMLPFSVLCGIYNMWMIREVNKARERETAILEERISQVSGYGTKSAGFKPDRSDVPGSPTYEPPKG